MLDFELPATPHPPNPMIDLLLNLVFPNHCVVCRAEVLHRKFGAACPECWCALRPLPAAQCQRCGSPEVSDGTICGRCRAGEYAFDFARSLFLFDDRLRTIIHHLKYAGRVSLARPLGQFLQDFVAREPYTGRIIVPIPLHRSRQRERGFNQAELLAGCMSVPVRRRLLRRRRNTESQTGRTRAQRRDNLRQAFGVRGRPPETVILLDDVFTTGTTLSEAARTLKKAGVRRVEVLTVGRVANPLPGERGPQADATVFSESNWLITQESLLSSKPDTKRV